MRLIENFENISKTFPKILSNFLLFEVFWKKTPFGVQTVTSLIISFGPCKRMRDFSVTENDLRYFSALCDLSKIFSKLIFLSTIFDYLMFSVMKTHSRDLRATLSITFWSCGTNETFLNNFGKDLCFFRHCDYSKKNLFGQMGNTTLSWMFCELQGSLCFELRKTRFSSLMGIASGIFGTANFKIVFSKVLPKALFRHCRTCSKKIFIVVSSWGKSSFWALCASLRVFIGTEKLI